MLIQLIEGQEGPGVLCHKDNRIYDEINLLVGIEEWKINPCKSGPKQDKNLKLGDHYLPKRIKERRLIMLLNIPKDFVLKYLLVVSKLSEKK